MDLNWGTSLLSFRFVLTLLVANTVSAYEEPEYEVLQQTDEYEIRQYASYLVAETRVSGDFDRTGNAAFRRLAGYIFGDNRSSTSNEANAAASVSMNMTVPVTRQKVEGEEGRSTVYRFVMERAYDTESLPVPNDERVKLTEEKGGRFAVLRYRGRITEERFKKYVELLKTSLERDGLATIGEPISAVYNGPFTLPMLRRNEVMFRLASAK